MMSQWAEKNFELYLFYYKFENVNFRFAITNE